MLAAVGEQSDKPLVSTFLASEGIPELLRVPDVAGSTAGRGSVPSYPAVEAAVRALARVVEYAAWRAKPLGELVARRRRRRDGRARQLVSRVLRRATEAGRDLDLRGAAPRCSRAYGIDLWDRAPRSTTEDEAVAAGERLGYDVVLKATADHLRQRPDLAHVWRNIDSEAEMRDAWTHHAGAHRLARRRPASSCRRSPRRACRSRSAAWRTRCSGRWCRSGSPGRRPSCSATGPTGSRRCTAATPSDMVREIKAAPLLFGYRGSEQVDVDGGRAPAAAGRPAQERPAAGARPSSSPGARRRRRRDGAQRASAGSSRSPTPRSDWFVRRLSTAGRGHAP